MEQDKEKVRTSGILQRLLVIFLTFIFLLTSGSLLLRYSIAKKLAILSAKLKAPPETGQISNVLLELNSAENDFQQAILYGYSDKLVEYEDKLLAVFNDVEKMLQEYEASGNAIPLKKDPNLKESFDGKLGLSLQVFKLKKGFDSLLMYTTTDKPYSTTPRSHVLRGKPRSISANSPDTIVKQIALVTKKKGFFKRLQDLFNPEEDTVRNKLLEMTRENAKLDSIAKVLQQKNEEGQRKLLKKLSQEHNLLAQSQQQLISSNLALITQIRGIIDQIKENYLKIWEQRQRENLAQYEESVDDLDQFTLTAIIMVLVFVVLLIIYIRKATRAEEQYQIENERAISLAEQKSELLATMSHEIRNPLTTIAGSVYLMQKTTLNEDQKSMIDAIKTSSDLLRETVNDILDMTKVENQQIEVLNIVAFTPYHELRETVEAMQFIAIRKGISLSFSFYGPEDAMIYGDPFRLKQVVLNLVGNAVKFTDQGKVVVEAILSEDLLDDTKELQVSVKDTGIGIDLEKQGKLFTKYYQADKNHARGGSGLGLYICHQLIKLQKGNISVQSEKGKGSEFRFTIPYKSSNV